jgi:cell division control protein 24
MEVVGDAFRSTFKLRPIGPGASHGEGLGGPTLALTLGSHHAHPLSPGTSSPMLRSSKKSVLPTSTPNAFMPANAAQGAAFVDPTPIPTLSTPSTNSSTMPPNTTSLLNKTATSSTGIYQQSVQLRARLQCLPAFAPFFEFSHSGARATKDVVQQLWETFSLGKPLCLLFNLQPIPDNVKIQEFSDGILDPDPLRKERQRAIALFIMGIKQLTAMGLWENDSPLFSISELVGDAMDTNGFVKVVATVLYLLNKLPPNVWSRDVTSSALPSQSSVASLTSREDIERANLVRELIETERKYCQDLEVMLSYSEYLGHNNIVDADTIHRLFPALKKLADFQRKLLIQMEGTAEHELDEQNWGACFAKHEPEFAIYDAYIANYSQALDLAIAEQPTLKVRKAQLVLKSFLTKYRLLRVSLTPCNYLPF